MLLRLIKYSNSKWYQSCFLKKKAPSFFDSYEYYWFIFLYSRLLQNWSYPVGFKGKFIDHVPLGQKYESKSPLPRGRYFDSYLKSYFFWVGHGVLNSLKFPFLYFPLIITWSSRLEVFNTVLSDTFVKELTNLKLSVFECPVILHQGELFGLREYSARRAFILLFSYFLEPPIMD